MKKIGIITMFNVNNYGTELQAYAAPEAMRLMGYDAENINYLYYKTKGHVSEKVSKPFYSYPLKNRLKEYGLRILDWINRIVNHKKYKEREARFDSFHKEFTKLSTKCYCRYSDLYTNPPIYDVYCVGSDQIWNPRCYTNLDPYFLTFAPKEAKRISFASSFGVSELPNDASQAYKERLGAMDKISVREPAGAELVKKIIGRDVDTVCDPTLLLEKAEWTKVAKSMNGIPNEFVLIYELHPIPYIIQFAEIIAKEKNLKIVRVCKDVKPIETDGSVINITTAGPSEFIYMFLKASVVVTNSFHGTAFSVNFGKEFYTILKRGLKNNSRQLGLLENVGLMDRIIYSDEDMALKPMYDVVESQKRLNRYKEQSIRFIKDAIDG